MNGLTGFSKTPTNFPPPPNMEAVATEEYTPVKASLARLDQAIVGLEHLTEQLNTKTGIIRKPLPRPGGKQEQDVKKTASELVHHIDAQTERIARVGLLINSMIEEIEL